MSVFRDLVDAICYPFRLLARIPSNVISSPRRMLGLSLPIRAALLLFFGLLLIVLGWSLLVLRLDGTQQLSSFLWYEVPRLLILVFIIPLVVWYALKLWLEGEPSPFPDIDNIWQAALVSMREQLINPSETPIFMVLGPSNPQAVERFMAASNIQYPVRLPLGIAPVHIWANQDAIYVICTESCCLSNFLGKGEPSPLDPKRETLDVNFDPSRTMIVGTGNSTFISEPLGSNPHRQTASVVPFGPGSVQLPEPINNPASLMQATMQVSSSSGAFGMKLPSAAPQPARRDSGRSGEASARLAYLCRCIRRVRDPLAPINGALITTPFKLLADGSQDSVNQMQIALKSDVSTLRVATRVRCSVTHVIDGMQEEAGFRELIRRVGSDRVATQRFGKGFGLWNLPTADQLDALVKHACGAFEDWSYLLFREEEGLGKRGNRHLYSLLCRIRLKLLPRLQNLIRAGYALESQSQLISGREPMLFSGCYFVADGSTPDRQAFLGSVFSKSRAEEEELEWGGEAINEENRMQTGVQIFLILNGVLMASIVAMLIKMYY